MPDKFQNKYRIPSNRWQFWDYSAPGSYFITICIQRRADILGIIINGEMHLSTYGEIIKNEFYQMRNYNERAILDEWVIMPNHVHFIITLREYDVEKIHEFSTQPTIQPTSPPTENDIKQYRRLRRKMVIPIMIGKFQQQTSKQINALRNTPGAKTWQPNYHDHVIRDEQEYERIRQYIINNPAKWEHDKLNGDNDGNDIGDGFNQDNGTNIDDGFDQGRCRENS
jgi:REP element-mobilizing transposase RayT